MGGHVRRRPGWVVARILAWRKVVSSVSLYVISLLSEFCFSPLKISFSLSKLLHTGGVGRVWGGVIEGIFVQRDG